MLLICDAKCLLEIGLLLPSLSQTASVVFPIKVSDFSASCQVANVTSHLPTEIPCGLKGSLSRELASKFTSTVETDVLFPVA